MKVDVTKSMNIDSVNLKKDTLYKNLDVLITYEIPNPN